MIRKGANICLQESRLTRCVSLSLYFFALQRSPTFALTLHQRSIFGLVNGVRLVWLLLDQRKSFVLDKAFILFCGSRETSELCQRAGADIISLECREGYRASALVCAQNACDILCCEWADSVPARLSTDCFAPLLPPPEPRTMEPSAPSQLALGWHHLARRVSRPPVRMLLRWQSLVRDIVNKPCAAALRITAVTRLVAGVMAVV